MKPPSPRLASLAALALASFGCGRSSPLGPSPQDAGLVDAGGADASLPDSDASAPAWDASVPAPDAGTCTTEKGTAGSLTNAFVDADHDGHGGPVPTVVCVAPGQSLPAGVQLTSDDCDDGNPNVWSTQPFFFDADGDGVGVEPATLFCASTPPTNYAAKAGDCAPLDPTRWQMLAYSYRDADSDGYSAFSPGEVCAGSALPLGYSELPGESDCDDTNPNLWQMLEYSYRDADGDGYYIAQGNIVCSGYSLPDGYSTSTWNPPDCDDYDPSVHAGTPSYFDKDGDGVGDGDVTYLCSPQTGFVTKSGDCAPDDATRQQMLSYSYRDADGDGWTVSQSGQVCSGAQLPAGYSSSSGKGSDCNDADPALYSLLYGYADADGDGVGAGDSHSFCTAGALPAGYVATGTDCAPDDPTRWRTATNVFADRDGDGYTVAEPGPICVGAQLPAPYVAAANGNDCDDTSSALWRWVVVYPDRDGDGVGAPPRQIQCLGSAIPAGYSTAGWDSDDSNPAIQWDPADLDFFLAD